MLTTSCGLVSDYRLFVHLNTVDLQKARSGVSIDPSRCTYTRDTV